jgi:hypothetical protein
VFIIRVRKKKQYTSTQSYTGYCGINQSGGPVTEQATVTSFSSQADADTKALAAATAKVNERLSQVCVPLDGPNAPAWQFDPTTEVCDLSVDKKPYRDSRAKMKDMNPLSSSFGTYRNSGQLYTYRISSPACPNPFTSAAYSKNFTKTNCPSNSVGSTGTLTVGAGAFTSLISQTEADNKAFNYLNVQDDGDGISRGQKIYNGTLLEASWPAYENNSVPKNFPTGTCSIPEGGTIAPTSAVFTPTGAPGQGFISIGLLRSASANALIVNGVVGIFRAGTNEQIGTQNFTIPSGSNSATVNTTAGADPSQGSFYVKVVSCSTSGYSPSLTTVPVTL